MSDQIFNDLPDILDASQIASALRISRAGAYNLLSSEDFPTLHIEIYLKFIGRVDLPEPELTPEEIAEQERLRKERLRSRERYRKLKSGELVPGRLYQLECKCCGKAFESKYPTTMYCSKKCGGKAHRDRITESRRRDCNCANCGTLFSTTRADVKYCCQQCKVEANRKKQKLRNAAKRLAQVEAELPDAATDSMTTETEIA